jgi:outer membrane murein-binding lipoprotein Lpp
MFDKYDVKIYVCSDELDSDNNSIHQKLNQIMANIQELTAQVDQLQADLDAEQQQIAEAITQLQQTITDLQALVVNGGTEAERQALADKLAAITADLQGTIAP